MIITRIFLWPFTLALLNIVFNCIYDVGNTNQDLAKYFGKTFVFFPSSIGSAARDLKAEAEKSGIMIKANRFC